MCDLSFVCSPGSKMPAQESLVLLYPVNRCYCKYFDLTATEMERLIAKELQYLLPSALFLMAGHSLIMAAHRRCINYSTLRMLRQNRDMYVFYR